MSKGFLKLLFICLTITVSNSYFIFGQENIIFIGHAYGSHNEFDRNIDPSVIKVLQNQNKLNIDEYIFGGDFIYDCKDKEELTNLFQHLIENNISLVIGNHDNCPDIKKFIKKEKGNLNYSRTYNENLLLYLNTSILTNVELKKIKKFVEEEVNKNNPKNVIIFCHQVIFSPNDFYLRTNSRKFYNYGNLFFRFLENTYMGSDKNFYIFTGDIGAFNYTPYSFYEKEKNFNLFAVGLGNKHKKNGIEIIIGESVSASFIDIESNDIVPPNVYNKHKIQILQFPKLVMFYIKSNILICISIFIVISFFFYFRKFQNKNFN